jgi:hypothetical protein
MRTILKSNKFLVLGFLIALLLQICIWIWKSSTEDTLLQSQALLEPFKSFTPQDLDFIKSHNLTPEFPSICKSASKDFSFVLKSLEKVEETKLGDLTRQVYRLNAFFWHDDIIFQFLESLNKAGFIRLLSLEIMNTGLPPLKKPSLKMEMLCVVFQKS